MNCQVIISQLTNLDRLLELGVPSPSILSSSSSIVRPLPPPPPRSLSLPIAPTPPPPVVQPPPPPLVQRISLRPRPTKKPKRLMLNIRKQQTNTAFK